MAIDPIGEKPVVRTTPPVSTPSTPTQSIADAVQAAYDARQAAKAAAGPAVDPSLGVVVTKAVEDAVAATFHRPSGFSSTAPDAWIYARYQMKDLYGLGTVTEINHRTEWAAGQYKNEFGRWPTGPQLMAYAPYQRTMQIYVSGGSIMDPVFDYLGEDGEVHRIINSGVDWMEPGPGWIIDALLDPRTLTGTGQQVPFYDNLSEVLAAQAPIGQPSAGSGRRGSGAGRAPLVFDRAQLAEDASNRWRGKLLEEPDDATLSSLVSDYISEASGFWMKEAGHLDFDTYVVNRARETNRYNFLYEKKPDFQSDEEYMTGFRNITGQFGMNDRAALRETEAGAHSGVGLAGFGERVGRTAEARLANTGSYSQRFAASMAQSGLGRT